MKLFSLISKKTWVKLLLILSPATAPATLAVLYRDATNALSRDLVTTNQELTMSLSERPKLTAQKSRAEGDRVMIKQHLDVATQSKANVIAQKKASVDALTKELYRRDDSLEEVIFDEIKLRDENETLRASLRNKNSCLVGFRFKQYKRTDECNYYLSLIRGGRWVRIK